MEPLFLKPLLQEKIWGGARLATLLNKPQSAQAIGEDWAISAHPHGPSTIMNGQFAGETFADVWRHQPALFGQTDVTTFPLLVKIIDAKEPLSVQVHPDDATAQRLEGELGKTECWYIMEAYPDAEIIYGHTAKTRAEFKERVAHDEWEQLLTHVPVQAGDFFYVPSGTIHAIGKGVVLLEIQQSSDTTYRLYDYDRFDQKLGRKRTLHLEKAIEVTTIPFTPPVLTKRQLIQDDAVIDYFVQNEFFTVMKWQVNGQTTFKQHAPYTLATVIAGVGQLEVSGEIYPLQVGTSFVLPTPIKEWTITGDVVLMAAEPSQK